MGGNGVFVQHKGDGLPLLYGVGVYLFYIDQRSGVIGGLHRARQHREHLQPDDARANKKQRQNHHQRNQDIADGIPDFSERMIHKTFYFSSSSKISALTFGSTKL